MYWAFISTSLTEDSEKTRPDSKPVLANGWYSLTVINLYTASRMLSWLSGLLGEDRGQNALPMLLVQLNVYHVMLSDAIIIRASHGFHVVGPDLIRRLQGLVSGISQVSEVIYIWIIWPSVDEVPLMHVGILEDVFPQRVGDLLEIANSTRLSESDGDVVVDDGTR